MTIPAPEVVARRPLTLRRGLRRLSTGLIAYGLIGLALALVGAFALAWVGGRVGAVADRTGEQVESIVSTLDETAFNQRAPFSAVWIDVDASGGGSDPEPEVGEIVEVWRGEDMTVKVRV